MKKHPNHIVLGIGMMMIGMWLIMNDHFFMWPPDSVEFANDDIWSGIFILIGFSLIAWVIDGHESIKWNRRLLAAYKPIRASTFQVSSNPKFKSNICEFTNGLDVVNGTKVNKYSLKNEIENDKYSNHVGMMLDDVPQEIVGDSEGIDLYSAVSVLWKSVQQLSAKVNTLESQLEGKEE